MSNEQRFFLICLIISVIGVPLTFALSLNYWVFELISIWLLIFFTLFLGMEIERNKEMVYRALSNITTFIFSFLSGDEEIYYNVFNNDDYEEDNNIENITDNNEHQPHENKKENKHPFSFSDSRQGKAEVI